MHYKEFIRTIVNSKPEQWDYDDDLGLYLFLDDISISILSDRSESDFDDNRFYEEWVTEFPDPKAYRARFLLRYNGVTIKIFYTVAIDGYRALIPYPKIKGMTISYEQYAIARIINIPYALFESKLKEANITVEQNFGGEI